MIRNEERRCLFIKRLFAVFVVVFAFVLSSGITQSRADSAEDMTPPEENIDRVTYWAEHPEDSPYQSLTEARYLAIVASCVAPDGGEAAQESVMWCVLNRVGSASFPNTVEEVCTQPQQWQGYDANAIYSSDTYALARSVLQRWKAGEAGNIPVGSVFMEVTAHGLKYRRQFNDSESIKIYFDNVQEGNHELYYT